MSGRAGRGRQADASTGAGARRWDARGAWQQAAAGRAGERQGRGRGAACARRLGQLGQVGVLFILTQFLDPVRLGIFSESLNEHCSL